MGFKWASQKEVRETSKSWREDLYSITTVGWKYVNQIPFSDIPMCISRTNSWNEAGLISTGQLSSLNQGLCRLVSLSVNCGKFSEVVGGSVAKGIKKISAFLYIVKHSTGLVFQSNHLYENYHIAHPA